MALKRLKSTALLNTCFTKSLHSFIRLMELQMEFFFWLELIVFKSIVAQLVDQVAWKALFVDLNPTKDKIFPVLSDCCSFFQYFWFDSVCLLIYVLTCGNCGLWCFTLKVMKWDRFRLSYWYTDEYGWSHSQFAKPFFAINRNMQLPGMQLTGFVCIGLR